MKLARAYFNIKIAVYKIEINDMSITKQKPTTETEATTTEEPHKPKYVRKGKKLQVTLTIAPALLERVDELAAKLGQSRAAVINMAVYRMVEHGVTIDGL